MEKYISKVSMGAIARKSASDCVPARPSLACLDRLREKLISPQKHQVGGLGLAAQWVTTVKEHAALFPCGFHNKLLETWGLKTMKRGALSQW